MQGKRQMILLIILASLLLVVSLSFGFLVSREEGKKKQGETPFTSEKKELVEVVSSPIDSVPRFKVEQMSKTEGVQELVLKNPKSENQNIDGLRQAFPEANLTDIPETTEYQATAGLFDRIEGNKVVIINAGKETGIAFSDQARLWLIEGEKTYIVSDLARALYLNEALLSHFDKGDLILALNVFSSDSGYSSSWFVNFR